MSVLRPLRFVTAGLVTALTVVIASPPAAARASAAAVHPIPMSGAQVLAQSLTPLSDADCLALAGIHCYQPFQLQKAYDVAPLFGQGIDGRGRTIVIVDPFGSPTIEDDLKTFDQAFGLPDPPSFQIIQPAGAVPPFPEDPFGPFDRFAWAGETTLDVELAHVLAPGAKILLVETPQSETEGVQGFPEIVQAENFVIDHDLGDVISQSFGAPEPTFPSAQSILDLRGAFVNARQHRVTVLASSGDHGAAGSQADGSCCLPIPAVEWPSVDPLVTSIGGTHVSLDEQGNRLSPDVVWNEPDFGSTGGGASGVFDRPVFQHQVRDVVGAHRGMPDISLNAAGDGAAEFFASFPIPFSSDPTALRPRFTLAIGTSEAAPLFAGLVALADQMAGERLGFLNTRLYELGLQHAPGIVDVTSGDNTFTFDSTTITGFTAGAGYDLASGWGTVDAALFVPQLASSGGDDGQGDQDDT
jgi:subtilase family serine protease